MQIRRKLTYRFISIVALILFFSSIAIYYSSADYRKDDFYNRLYSKAQNTAKLLIEVEEVDADLLRKLETDNPLSLPEERIEIYNYRNQLLFNTDGNDALNVDSKLLDKIRLEEEIRYVQNGYEVVGFLFTDKYDRFVVVAGASDIYGFKKLKNLRNILIVVFLISILVVSITGWIYAGRALSPINAIVSKVNSISISSLNLRLDEGVQEDEITRLARTFNKMLDRLESSFTVQKNFIANASHELRTPLTAITGQLEVVLMRSRTDEEYRNTIISVLEDIKNLNSISNRLLLLAQASSEIARTDVSTVRVDDLLWQCRSELLKHHPNYRVEIEIDENIDSEDSLKVTGNEQLLKTAIANLMENGCKYSDPPAIKIKLASAKGKLYLQFIDEGIGIPAKDLKNIFEPFFRAGNALTIKGHGIGLSLVQKAIQLHKGHLEVQSDTSGTTFTVSLPLASAF